MKSAFSFLIVVICNFIGFGVAHAESVATFTNRFQHPQFLQDNATALQFRLALLDNAAAGSQVRIATFTYEDGTSTQALAAHMCSAVSRGVKVELIVDAKSGEIEGQPNPYNNTDAVKKTEHAFTVLANCGVQIFIHNYTTDFVTISILNKRVPNIFGAQVKSGDSINLISADLRLKDLRTQLTTALRPTFAAQRLGVDTTNVLSNIQSLALSIAQFPTAPDQGNVDGTTGQIIQDYRAIVDDPFWGQFDEHNPKTSIAKMTAVDKSIISILEKDPVLKIVRDKLRVFNRLNHRKLFMVQEPGGQSCVIIGGRNLGDLYLTNSATSYRDGDVFFCTQQAPKTDHFLTEVNASLDQLKTDTSDTVLSATAKTVVKQIKAIHPTHGPRVAAVGFSALKGDDLGPIENPVLLTSNWSMDGQSDGVRMALLEAILRERKELYIESAYGEFNKSLRDALEIAMKTNGVKVHIVTNGLFMADGASKLIRIWMAKWNDEMSAKYPHLFQTDFAPLSGGHMIHFKGAGFRCQAGVNNTFYRQYIVGSHNFHPRSGYSDKEHAIEWRETTDSTCAEPASDMISLRMKYYQNQRALNHAPVLRTYGSLLEEIHEATFRFDDFENSNLARALEQAMYFNGQLHSPERVNWIQDLLDQSGLRDLVGILL